MASSEMEGRGGDSDEPMSTTSSPVPIDTHGHMSVESSPQHFASNSPAPGEVLPVQSPHLALRKPPSMAVSVNLLRALASSRAGIEQEHTPLDAIPDNGLPAQASTQQVRGGTGPLYSVFRTKILTGLYFCCLSFC